MSTHQVLVHKLEKIDKHPNADSLGLTKIFGYQICIKLNEFKEGDLVVYIEPDFCVPNNEQFAFLNGHTRIKSRKFRGIYSEGLLIKALPDMKLGDDVMERLGIIRYEPPVDICMNGEDETGPSGNWPHYGVENYKKHNTLIVSGEEVIISEKLNGCNALYVWLNDRLWVKSRKHWKKKDDKNLYWKTLLYNAWIESFCQHHEGYGLFGEIFGQVKGFSYGSLNRSPQFAIFDIYYKNQWLEYDDARKIAPGCIFVPELYRGPFDKDKTLQMAEEDSSIKGANHCREGIVVQPLLNRFNPEIGRVKLKIVGNRYLQKE
jgi:RNA ligase (TIGR02306 family)